MKLSNGSNGQCEKCEIKKCEIKKYVAMYRVFIL